MQAGSVLGAYRVVRQIGAGGMGSVWMAEHTMLGRRAALKVLHPEMSARHEIVRRFFNEARAATAIPDPGIVQIFDFGYADDGSAYIVMELLDGEVLEQRIARGRLEVAQTLRIMRQVASTLGAAHERGIVHRDLKPENIFMAKDPEVPGGERAKILDFGIAKLNDERRTGAFDLHAPVVSMSSGILGTPFYMSPEQCQGHSVDARSDVYALGCVLFQMLTGSLPFDAASPELLLFQHLTAPVPLPSSIASDIPPAIDQLVERCLAKSPDRRYGSGAELALAITSIATSSLEISASLDEDWSLLPTVEANSRGANQGVASAPSPGDAEPLNRPATTLSRAIAIVRASPRKRSSVVLAVGAAAAIGAGGIAWSVAHDARESDPPAAPPAVSKLPAARPADDPPAPDHGKVLADAMGEVLTRFVTWSHEHAGAPCPEVVELGPPVNDPWAHPLRLTCSDQPQNQMVGVISAGPDGVLGNADDVGSWQLGRAVSDLAYGPRWATARPEQAAPEAAVPPEIAAPAKATAPAVPKRRGQATKPPGRPPQKKPIAPPPRPGIALDANGVPVNR